MRKKIIAIIVLLFMLVSIPVGVFLVKKRQEIQLRAAPATTLSLLPAAESYNINEPFTVTVQIETGTNIAAAADLEISYNSQVLTVQDIIPGSFFDSPNELRKDINTPGKIYYSIGSLTPKQGSGILASISFKGIAAGTSTVPFDPTTQVGGVDEGNVLANTTPGSYLIVEAQPTATPILTPTPTGPGEPTATPTVTPTTTPTPTPAGGAGGPGEPTATPTPTPTTAARTTLTPTPTVSEELPEAGIPTATFLFLIGGGLLLFLSFGRLLFP